MLINGHNVYIRKDFKPQKDWAVFFDRDGVINQEKNFAFKVEDLVLIPEVVVAIKKLNQRQIPVIVLHNAAAVARNLCSLREVEKFNQAIIDQLAVKAVYLDAIFYCPHHFNAYNPDFKCDCDWRKPGAGMIFAAAKIFNLNLAKSFLLGDNQRDIQAGETARVKSFLIQSGKDIIRIINKIIL